MRHRAQSVWLVLLLAATAWLHWPAAAAADEADDQYAVAAGHYARGRWQLAADEFELLLKDFAQHARADEAVYYLAESFTQQGRFEQAAARFEEFLQRCPSDERAIKSRFRAGEARYLSGQHAAAETHLEQLALEHPTEPLLAYALPYLGEIALSDGRDELALHRFTEGLQRFPQGPMQDDCRLGKAKALQRLGRDEEAHRLLLAVAAKKASPLADEAQYRLGCHLLAQRQLPEAEAALAELQARHPTSRWLEHAQLGRAQALYLQQQCDAALPLLEPLTCSATLAVEALYWRGLTEQCLGHFEKATETLLAAARLDPQHHLLPELLYQAGTSLRRDDRHAEAMQQFDRLLSEHPSDELVDEAMLAAMQCALAFGDHAVVERRMLDFNQHRDGPVYGEAVRVLARSRLARGRFEQAHAALLAINGRPELPAELAETFYLHAAALHGMGDSADALHILAHLPPEASANLMAASDRLRGTILVALGRFNEAIAPIEAGLAAGAAPHEAAQARAQLALCHASSGDFELAVRQYRALTSMPADQNVRLPAIELLAEAALRAERLDLAAMWFGDLAESQQGGDHALRGLLGLGWTLYRASDLQSSSEALSLAMQQYPAHAEAAEAAVLCGRVLEQMLRSDAALLMYQAAYEHELGAPVASQALLQAARLLDHQGENARAIALYERLVRDHADSAEHHAALYHGAWAQRDAGQEPTAIAWFERLAREHADSAHTADALYRLAQHAFERQELAACQEHLDALLGTCSASDELLAHALCLQAQVAAAAERWSDVTAPLAQLKRQFPESTLRPLADYWIAEAAYRQDQFEHAGQLLEALVADANADDPPWLVLAQIRQAQVLVHQQKWPEAQELAETLRERHADLPQRYELDYVIGRCRAAQGFYDEAREAYRQVTRSQQGGKTETAAMAQGMIGETLLHQKHYEAAAREYLRLEILYDYPTWQAAALLQAGKCYELLGQWSQAGELYQRLLDEYPQTEFAEQAAARQPQARKQATKR